MVMLQLPKALCKPLQPLLLPLLIFKFAPVLLCLLFVTFPRSPAFPSGHVYPVLVAPQFHTVPGLCKRVCSLPFVYTVQQDSNPACGHRPGDKVFGFWGFGALQALLLLL